MIKLWFWIERNLLRCYISSSVDVTFRNKYQIHSPDDSQGLSFLIVPSIPMAKDRDLHFMHLRLPVDEKRNTWKRIHANT